MYLPKHYAVTDRSRLFEFMKNNNFGILFSHTGSEPMASHLPFMLDENGGEHGAILGHMARANRQWRYSDGQQVLVVFHGPHTYVSPTWYREEVRYPRGTTSRSTPPESSGRWRTDRGWKRAWGG